jgi:hypothetical protein
MQQQQQQQQKPSILPSQQQQQQQQQQLLLQRRVELAAVLQQVTPQQGQYVRGLIWQHVELTKKQQQQQQQQVVGARPTGHYWALVQLYVGEIKAGRMQVPEQQ